MGQVRRWIGWLVWLFAGLLSLSLLAKWVAGYIVRSWSHFCRSRGISVDVIAPNFGPAMVVSTEEFDDPSDLDAEYHTKTLRRVARFELFQKIAVWASLVALLVAFVLYLLLPAKVE